MATEPSELIAGPDRGCGLLMFDFTPGFAPGEVGADFDFDEIFGSGPPYPLAADTLLCAYPTFARIKGIPAKMTPRKESIL